MPVHGTLMTSVLKMFVWALRNYRSATSAKKEFCDDALNHISLFSSFAACTRRPWYEPDTLGLLLQGPKRAALLFDKLAVL